MCYLSGSVSCREVLPVGKCCLSGSAACRPESDPDPSTALRVAPSEVEGRQGSLPDKYHFPTNITSRQISPPDKYHFPSPLLLRSDRFQNGKILRVDRVLGKRLIHLVPALL